MPASTRAELTQARMEPRRATGSAHRTRLLNIRNLPKGRNPHQNEDNADSAETPNSGVAFRSWLVCLVGARGAPAKRNLERRSRRGESKSRAKDRSDFESRRSSVGDCGGARLEGAGLFRAGLFAPGAWYL